MAKPAKKTTPAPVTDDLTSSSEDLTDSTISDDELDIDDLESENEDQDDEDQYDEGQEGNNEGDNEGDNEEEKEGSDNDDDAYDYDEDADKTKTEVNDEPCLYKKANLSDSEEEGDDEAEEVFDDEDEDEKNTKGENIYVPKEQRITKPFLTKYERVRLIGDRTKQLSGGAKPLIKNVDHLSAEEIAKLELQHNIIPLIIERPLPNGLKERWTVNELQQFN